MTILTTPEPGAPDRLYHRAKLAGASSLLIRVQEVPLNRARYDALQWLLEATDQPTPPHTAMEPHWVEVLDEWLIQLKGYAERANIDLVPRRKSDIADRIQAIEWAMEEARRVTS